MTLNRCSFSYSLYMSFLPCRKSGSVAGFNPKAVHKADVEMGTRSSPSSSIFRYQLCIKHWPWGVWRRQPAAASRATQHNKELADCNQIPPAQRGNRLQGHLSSHNKRAEGADSYPHQCWQRSARIVTATQYQLTRLKRLCKVRRLVRLTRKAYTADSLQADTDDVPLDKDPVRTFTLSRRTSSLWSLPTY
jgi:hypothetical protein